MPISTPDLLIPKYGNDEGHFLHVLECLFIPAIEKAGLKPIPPIAKGADVIHAGIIQNIEKAEIVLCDMSSLNANVFFELGIRTAIGKPVCVVKDEVTAKVPFDMTVVNYHTYGSSLASWTLNKEIEALAAHLKSCLELSAGENLLWKYFSLSQRANLTPPTQKDETHDRLQLISAQIEGLSKKISNQTHIVSSPYIPSLADEIRERRSLQVRDEVFLRLSLFLKANGLEFQTLAWNTDGSEARLTIAGQPDQAQIEKMQNIAYENGCKLFITNT